MPENVKLLLVGNLMNDCIVEQLLSVKRQFMQPNGVDYGRQPSNVAIVEDDNLLFLPIGVFDNIEALETATK